MSKPPLTAAFGPSDRPPDGHEVGPAVRDIAYNLAQRLASGAARHPWRALATLAGLTAWR